MRSAVAGTSERLRRRVYEVTGLHEVFNDSNVSVLLKSSREKTVAALSPIAEKTGKVVKLNDTGSWKERHALLVPHTFLYYFSNSGQAAAGELRPHGVIDLELYTDVRVVDETVVRLAPVDEMLPIRTFYLRLSNKGEAEAWARAIRETRFGHVRNERDVLLRAKAVLTEQVTSLSEALRDSRAAIVTLQRREAAALSELARYDANNARRVEQVQALLAAAGGNHPGGGNALKENGMAAEVGPGGGARVREGGGAAGALAELVALGEAIADRAREIADLKAENAAFRADADATAELRRRDAATALKLLEEERKRTAEEADARLALENELRCVRQQLEEDRACKEEARANLGVVAAACREAEAKARELQEHRRVLAREVKASRAERRRLSAALACATTASATAAATVAVSRSTSSGSSGAVVDSGDRFFLRNQWTTAGDEKPCNTDGDSSVGVDDVNGENATLAEVDCADELMYGEKEDTGCGEANSEGREKQPRKDEGTANLSDRQRRSGGAERERDSAVVESSSWSEGKTLAGECDCVDGAVEAGVNGIFSPGPTSSRQRAALFSLDGESLRVSEGCGHLHRTRADTGATSPEAGSPSVCDRSGSGSICRPISPWASISVTNEEPTPEPAGAGGHGEHGVFCTDDRADGCSDKSDTATETTCDGSNAQTSLSTPLQHGRDQGGAGTGFGCGGIVDNGTFLLPASPTKSVPASGNGDSRLINMVQSFSAGFRENRRVRRRPVLGALDDDSHGAKGEEDDDGGVTDGTDGDSRHGVTGGSSMLFSFSGAFGGDTTAENEGRQGMNAGLEEGANIEGKETTIVLSTKDYGSNASASAASTTREVKNHDSPSPFAKDLHGLPFLVSPFPGAKPPATTAVDADSSTSTESKVGSMLTRVVAKVRQKAATTAAGVEVGSQSRSTSPFLFGSNSPTTVVAAAGADYSIGSGGGGRWKVVSVSSNDSSVSGAICAGETPPKAANPAVVDWIKKVARREGEEPTSSRQAEDEDKAATHVLSVPPHLGSPVSTSPARPTNQAVAAAGTGADVSPLALTAARDKQAAGIGEAKAGAVEDGAAATTTMGVAAAAVAAAERGSRAPLEAATAARRWEAKLKGTFISVAGGVRWGMGTQKLNGSLSGNSASEGWG